MELIVECKKRAAAAKPNALRRAGLIPAVLYGHKGTESISLTVEAKTAEHLVRDASVNNTLIQVNIPDLPWSGQALLRDVQTHPWKKRLYHLSFFSVAAQNSLTVDVPLNFVGDAVGVTQGGGALDTVLTELQVECAPSDIPEAIEIDVSGMNIGDALHVHELVLPKGVTAVGEPDRVIVSVLQPQTAAAGDAETETESASESDS
jgi:large subunit ribosomal protein L25